MPRLLTSQPPFRVLVSNLEGSSDPGRGLNPVKIRTGITSQHILEIPRDGVTNERVLDPRTPGVHIHEGMLAWTTPGVPVGATATILVASNTFTNPAILFLGNFTVTSGADFTVGGGVNATATALAAAIDALPGFAASAATATVTVTGPVGLDGNEVLCTAVYRGTVRNYTITNVNGYMSGAEPRIGPPTITP